MLVHSSSAKSSDLSNPSPLLWLCSPKPPSGTGMCQPRWHCLNGARPRRVDVFQVLWKAPTARSTIWSLPLCHPSSSIKNPVALLLPTWCPAGEGTLAYLAQPSTSARTQPTTLQSPSRLLEAPRHDSGLMHTGFPPLPPCNRYSLRLFQQIGSLSLVWKCRDGSDPCHSPALQICRILQRRGLVPPRTVLTHPNSHP